MNWNNLFESMNKSATRQIKDMVKLTINSVKTTLYKLHKIMVFFCLFVSIYQILEI